MAFSAARGPVGVCRNDSSGDVLIWSLPLPMRRVGGSWIGGDAALKGVPSADELKDGWSIVFEPEASALLAEARTALDPR
jgi:hypothetical protein